MNDYIFSSILIGAAILTGIIINLITFLIFRRRQKFAILKKLRILFSATRNPRRFLIPSACILFVSPLLRLSERILNIFGYVLNLWIIACAGWLLIRIAHAVREIILTNYDFEAKDNLQARRIYTQTRVIENIATTVILLFTVSFMLMSYPAVRQIGVSILASAGVAGIVLGFAAQKTLGNFVAGIQLAFTQPMRLDDVVIVEGEWGWIEEITLTYVVVRIWDLRRLVVPISYFIEKPFQNWTRISADILGSVFIYADYTVPVKPIREELTRILKASSYWDKKVDCLQVTNATDRTVELRALMSAADSPTAWNLRCEVREKLLEFLQQKYPQCLPRVRLDLDKGAVK
jgi:small-conductance mechanosensitive channel